MSRYGATAIHIGLSCIIFVALAYVILFIWYPDFFFETDGGWQGIRIIVAVDLVLGPLLTLVVFKAGKPGLRFDLTVIGVTQAVCLVAGMWIIHSERPIAMVYVDGQFFSVSHDDYTEAGVEVPELGRIPGSTPKWVMVDVPADFEQQSELRAGMLKRGVPLRLAVDRYVPFEVSAALASVPIETVDIGDADAGEPNVPSGAETPHRFFPFGARYANGLIAFDTQTGALVGVFADQELKSSSTHG